MQKVTYEVSMSLDGFVAGPNQSVDNPLGERGEELHLWMQASAEPLEEAVLAGSETNANSGIPDEETEGAIIMGRNMFGGGPGPWNTPLWEGWWGDNPPFHVPVFVLTHFPRPVLEMEGGTTFTFVTDGIESALRSARAAAGKRNVGIGGGHTAAQYLAAGLLDELSVHLVPVFLRGGVRLFDLMDNPLVQLEQLSSLVGPGVTHITYSVRKNSLVFSSREPSKR